MVRQVVTSEGAGVTCVPWNTYGPLKLSRGLAEWPDDYNFPGCLSVRPSRTHIEDPLLWHQDHLHQGRPVTDAVRTLGDVNVPSHLAVVLAADEGELPAVHLQAAAVHRFWMVCGRAPN